MPQHVYLPARQPPTWWDRVLVHPMDHAAALTALIFGVLMAVVSPITGAVPSPAFNNVPWWLNWGAGVSLLLGGALIVAGLHWIGEKVSTGWAAELLGWSLATGGFAAVTLAFAAGQSPAAWIIPGVLALGSLLRWVSLWMIIQAARKVVNEATAAPGREA